LSDSPELLKPNVEVTDSELQIELGNSKIENETLKADYAKLLESSTNVTNKLRQEVQELRSQLETERADRKKIGAKRSSLKKNSSPAAILSEKLTPDATTILNQLARQAQKIPGVTCRHRGNFGDYRGVLREHIPGTLGINPG
jgi:DNA gyrase/topoisomerase IV subunit A